MVLFDHPAQVPLFFLHLAENLIEMLLLVWLYGHIYGRPHKSAKHIVLLAVALVLLASCALRVVLPPRRSISGEWIPMLCSLPLLCIYNRATWKKRIVMSLLLLSLSYAYGYLTNYLTTPYIWTHPNVMEVVGHGVFWLLLVIVRWAGAKERATIPASMSILLALIGAASLGLLAYTRYEMGLRENPYGGRLEIPVMATLLFINLSLFFIFGNLAKLMRQAQEKSMMEQQLHLQEEHYRQMSKAQERIRVLHHDMKNHLATAARLAEVPGNDSEVARYLQGASEELRAYEQVVYSGNPSIDSVLSLKLTELKTAGIDVQAAVNIPPGIRLSFQRAATIFGNLLDNVGEALRGQPSGSRTARLSVSYLNHCLLIRSENFYPEAPADWRDGLPHSTKQDGSLHGLGLRNVREAVEPGSMEVVWIDGVFAVEIVLYEIEPTATQRSAK